MHSGERRRGTLSMGPGWATFYNCHTALNGEWQWGNGSVMGTCSLEWENDWLLTLSLSASHSCITVATHLYDITGLDSELFPILNLNDIWIRFCAFFLLNFSCSLLSQYFSLWCLTDDLFNMFILYKSTNFLPIDISLLLIRFIQFNVL